jgi:hypothetical protein
MEPSATSAAAAMKSGGQGIRSASSMIQAWSASGSSVSASKAGTGFSSAMMGFGAGQARTASAVPTILDCRIAATACSRASGIASTCARPPFTHS